MGNVDTVTQVVGYLYPTRWLGVADGKHNRFLSSLSFQPISDWQARHQLTQLTLCEIERGLTLPGAVKCCCAMGLVGGDGGTILAVHSDIRGVCFRAKHWHDGSATSI